MTDKPKKPRPRHLVSVEEGPVDVSHFMHLVSAYEPNAKTSAALALDLRRAVKTAKKEIRPVIVEQDCIDFFFVVHPSGTIDLCCRMRSYTLVELSEYAAQRRE